MNTNYVLLDIAEVTKPKDGLYRIYQDYYYLVTKDNQLLNYGGHSLQCNRSKNVMDNFNLKIHNNELEVRQIPFVYLSFEVSDYV